MDFPSSFISGQRGWGNMDTISAVPYNGHFESLVCSQAQQAPPCANPHVSNLACSPVGRTSPPSGASDLLQQAMDLSMIGSPPRSPYGYCGMFSPVTHSLSPANTPGYLSRLQKNPLLRDLQMLLSQECYGVQVPANLITTGWNLMQLPLMDSSAGTISGSQNVYLRHMQFQDKLLKVRIDPLVSADGLKVENEYSTKVGQIEMGRYHNLVSDMGNTVLKPAVNSYYDKERTILVEKAEADLDRLIAKAGEIRNAAARAKKIRTSVTRTNVMQKESSVGTPLVGNIVKTCSAVRHISFGTMDDSTEKDSFDSGFKLDVEDLYVGRETISGNNNINTNCAHIVTVSQSCSRKQKTTSHILYEDEKHAKKTSSVQPDSIVNLSPVKPFSDKSFLINCENMNTSDQHRSFQTPFNCLDLSHSTPRKGFKDTVICTPELGNSHSVELSPLNNESDFLFRIACESSRNSNGVQSNSRSQAQSQMVRLHLSESKASSSSQENSNLDKTTDPASGMGYSKENTNPSSSSHLSCLKTHKVLSKDAVHILSMWYEHHLQYPYPTDEEVKELSEWTGVTEKQVKKWMANKRIRCFNTLSITGNKHPLKFKYEGRGRKRTHSEVGKDDSSFEPNSNSLTEESRRILNNWFDGHLENPYPLEEEKKELAEQCGITLAQVKSWFANRRSRTNNTRK